MGNLTEKQLKTRWIDIKKQIKERQLLAYRVGIPLDKWDAYMHSLPDADEINRIYNAIQEDRKTKTHRVKEELSKLVGYREARHFSKKIGVSDASIRDIIEGKKEMAGYELINKLELFLNRVMPEFEPSIENPLTIKAYTQDYLGEVATSLDRTADRIKQYCFRLTEMARKMEKERDWNGIEKTPSSDLDFCVKNLTELKEQIDSFWSTYVERNLN